MLAHRPDQRFVSQSFILRQILLENTSETQESNAYTLSVRMRSNQEGLSVFVGGQPLVSSLVFRGVAFGSSKVIVEVFRGPNYYDYSNTPITLTWGSTCDGSISSSIQLKPTFLQPCAKAEFHDTLKTFALDDSLAARDLP